MTPKCPNCMIELKQVGKELRCPECSFYQRPNEKVIKAIYAWMSVDQTNEFEGIVAMRTNNNIDMPLISSNLALVKQLKRVAIQCTLATGMKAKLIKFTRDEVIDET